MGGAAEVTEVQLYATHDAFSEGEFYNAEILLCHTTLPALTTSFEANYAGNEPVPVFSLDTLAIDWTAPGWNGLVFDRGFDYDGTSNLIIEFRYLGEDGRTINARAFYPPTPDRTLDAGLPTSPSGDLLTFMNSLRIYFTPASGGGWGQEGDGPVLSVSTNPCAVPVLEAGTPGPCRAVLDVFSCDGRLAWSWTGDLDGGTCMIAVPAGELPDGFYVARLAVGSGSASVPFLVVD